MAIDLDALSEGVAVLDESGKILRCNRAMSELLELAYTEIEGKLLGELLNGSLASLLVTNDQLKVQELAYRLWIFSSQNRVGISR